MSGSPAFTRVLSRTAATLEMRTPKDRAISGCIWVGTGLALRYCLVSDAPPLVIAALLCLGLSILRFVDKMHESGHEQEAMDNIDEESEAVLGNIDTAPESLQHIKAKLNKSASTFKRLSRRIKKGLMERKPVAIAAVVVMCITVVIITKLVPLPILALPLVTITLAAPAVYGGGIGSGFRTLADKVEVQLLRVFVSTIEMFKQGKSQE